MVMFRDSYSTILELNECANRNQAEEKMDSQEFDDKELLQGGQEQFLQRVGSMQISLGVHGTPLRNGNMCNDHVHVRSV